MELNGIRYESFFHFSLLLIADRFLQIIVQLFSNEKVISASIEINYVYYLLANQEKILTQLTVR